MKTVNENITALLTKHVQLNISGFVDVFEDDYENGQDITACNGWNFDKVSHTFDTVAEMVEAFPVLVNKYLDSNVYYERTTSNNFYFDFDAVYLSQMVDSENSPLSENDFELFKEGKLKAYVQDIRLYFTVNGTELTEDILRELLKGVES